VNKFGAQNYPCLTGLKALFEKLPAKFLRHGTRPAKKSGTGPTESSGTVGLTVYLQRQQQPSRTWQNIN
jgi:hypothetical protein